MPKLKVGDKMPDFEFKTGYETGKHVSEVLKGKTVFWVLRYIGCTTCRYDVHVISQRYEEFTAKGAQVFVVMQSDQAHIQKEFAEIGRLPFDIICDDEMKIYKELTIEAAKSKLAMVGGGLFKLLSKSKKIKAAGFSHGDYEGDEMQLPAMFIVEEDGTVSYAHYAENLMDMPDVDQVLALL